MTLLLVTQRSFFKSNSEHSKSRVAHGGDISKGRAKLYRPLDRKRPLHIEMKSSLAKGRLSLLARKLEVESLVKTWAAKCAVTIHEFENMGNHLHFVVSFKVKSGIQKFLRTITGRIAKLITKAERGRPFGQKFWDGLVFTRMITGRRDFQNMQRYMLKNCVQRDAGPAWREGMELAEKMKREARRRRISLDEIKFEYLEEFEATRASRKSR